MEPDYHQLEFDTRLWLTHRRYKATPVKSDKIFRLSYQAGFGQRAEVFTILRIIQHRQALQRDLRERLPSLANGLIAEHAGNWPSITKITGESSVSSRSRILREIS